MGKALGSLGAYTLFRDGSIGDFLVNYSDEFIYSTYLNPANAAIAIEAVDIVRASTPLRRQGQSIKVIRRSLNALGLSVAEVAIQILYRLLSGMPTRR